MLLPWPIDNYQMELVATGVGEFVYKKNSLDESRFSFRADLPEGDPANPFRCEYTIKVQLPGGTPVGESHYFSVDQYRVDPDSGTATEFIGGNDFVVSFQ